MQYRILVNQDEKVIGAFIRAILYNCDNFIAYREGENLIVEFFSAELFEWYTNELERLKRVIKDQDNLTLEWMLSQEDLWYEPIYI